MISAILSMPSGTVIESPGARRLLGRAGPTRASNVGQSVQSVSQRPQTVPQPQPSTLLRYLGVRQSRREERRLRLTVTDAALAPRRRSRWQAVTLIVLAIVGLAGLATFDPPSVAGASEPKVAVIVGPAGTQTADNKTWGDAAVREALLYTSNVVKVYSPNATWSRVQAAMTGASVVVYIGRGRGFPSPYSSTLQKSTQDGFGLNPVAGRGNSTTKFYGERYIRAVRLAPQGVVLLHRAAYAAGSSEPGRAQPTLTVARRRVDNYGAGFLATGASVVIAETRKAPTYYIRAIFTKNTSLDSVWRSAPWRHGHVRSFNSSRTRGAVGRTDPVKANSGYHRSIVGFPATSTAAARHGGLAASGSRPFPAPVTTRTVSVPSSIDASGATDVSAALNAFIKSVPDGSTIVFKAGGTYRLEPQGIVLYNRHNLVLEGNGATLGCDPGGMARRPDQHSSQRTSIGHNSHISIRNFTLVGSNPNTTTIYSPGSGEEPARRRHLGRLVHRDRREPISKTYGDGVYISGNDDTHVSADSVWIHDNTFTYIGRNGIALTAGSNVTIEQQQLRQGRAAASSTSSPTGPTRSMPSSRSANNSVGSYAHNTTAWSGSSCRRRRRLGHPRRDGDRQHGDRQPSRGLRRAAPRAQHDRPAARRAEHRRSPTTPPRPPAAGPVLYFATSTA